MFTKTLRLCTNHVRRQIREDIVRQISKTTSVTNSEIINISSQRSTDVVDDGQTKKLLKLRKYHRYVC